MESGVKERGRRLTHAQNRKHQAMRHARTDIGAFEFSDRVFANGFNP
jgi:hypothetical protein